MSKNQNPRRSLKNNSKEGVEITSAPSEFLPGLHLRKCVGCNTLHPRENMIRIMRVHQTNNVVINPDSKTFGRSVYLCSDSNCLNFATKKKSIERFLKTKINQDILENIKIMIN